MKRSCVVSKEHSITQSLVCVWLSLLVLFFGPVRPRPPPLHQCRLCLGAAWGGWHRESSLQLLVPAWSWSWLGRAGGERLEASRAATNRALSAPRISDFISVQPHTHACMVCREKVQVKIFWSGIASWKLMCLWPFSVSGAKVGLRWGWAVCGRPNSNSY